jgi:hypothetical protein
MVADSSNPRAKAAHAMMLTGRKRALVKLEVRLRHNRYSIKTTTRRLSGDSSSSYFVTQSVSEEFADRREVS